MPIPEYILQSILDQILTFLSQNAQDVVDDLITGKQIRSAIQSAVNRFELEYPDKVLSSTLVSNLDFFTLPSVQLAIQDYLAHPLAVSPLRRIEDSLRDIYPKKAQRAEITSATLFFLNCLRQELGHVTKLQDRFGLVVQEKILNVLENIDENINKPKKSDLLVSRKNYLKYVVDANQYVDPRGILQTRRSLPIKLDQIYISLKAEYDVKDYIDIDRFLKNYKEISKPQNYDEIIKTSIPLEELDKPDFFSLAEVLRNNSKIVILGDPGSGKTTMIKYITYIFGLHYLENLDEKAKTRVVDNDFNDYGQVSLPIFVRISSFADAFSADRAISLRSFILEGLGETFMASTEIRSILEEAIDTGDALILLDGLDEVVNVTDRAEIGRRIEQFVSSSNPRNRFVITSRVSGYRVVPLAGDFSHYTIKELDKDQIQSFLYKWCSQIEAQTPLDGFENKAKKQAFAIYKAIQNNSGIRRIASNPLMLAILVLVFRNENQLSSKRFEIYEKAVVILLKDWQNAKGLLGNAIIREHEISHILAPLAYWIHETKVSRLASGSEIKQKLFQIFNFLKNSSDGDLALFERVEDFFSRVVDIGIITEFSPDRYGFLHLSFQEYFVAKHLLQSYEEIEGLVYLHKHMPNWFEPIVLLISNLSETNPDVAISILKKAILCDSQYVSMRTMLPSRFEELLHRDLLLAVRIIAEWPTIDKRLHYLIIKFLDVYVSLQYFNVYNSLQRRLDALITLLVDSGKGALMGELLAKLLEHEFFSQGWDKVEHNNNNSDFNSADFKYSNKDIARKIGVDMSSNRFTIIYECAVRFKIMYSIDSKRLSNILKKMERIIGSFENTVRSKNQLEPNLDVSSLRASLEDEKGLSRRLNSGRDLPQRTVHVDLSNNFELIKNYRSLISVRDSNDNDLFEFLEKCLFHSSGLVRYEAMRCIRIENIRYPDFESLAIEALKDRLDDVCIEAASTLMQWNLISSNLVNWLIHTAKRTSNLRHLRCYSIGALGAMGAFSRDVIDLLMELTSDSDWNVRGDALLALGSLDVYDETIFKIIFERIMDDVEYVQVKSVISLGKISANSNTPKVAKESISVQVYGLLKSRGYYFSTELDNVLWETLWQSTSL